MMTSNHDARLIPGNEVSGDGGVNGRHRVRTDPSVGWLAVGALGAAAAAVLIRRRRPPATNAYYVALGSSFAAGLGLGQRAPGSPLVSQRGVDGYPQQLARLLRVPSFTDMTSSGSTVRQVLRGGQMLLGPQIDALGPDTRLVTLTAGGNDVGYVGDLTFMALRNEGGLVGTILKGVWQGPKRTREREFRELDANLRATLREIRRRSPLARIVVATYPAILPDALGCRTLGITEGQAAAMRAVADELARVTRVAAGSTGAAVVDMAVTSKGHDACSKDPWVNGFRPEHGASFHPNREGAEATAKAIVIEVERLGVAR
ncbi:MULTISPECIES: SGNH/GDSL hydrolase family protein [unclassified Methylobacterium]|uniref:SGNH/GDSL hydrolase family protein n=1 Tax=unclassified Methylobacterium TaxID=2615210 RepID=UPI00226990EA|nr:MULTISPECIES: SGNH/GDSL hydrolase family protein [unclassified Methylobacterium]